MQQGGNDDPFATPPDDAASGTDAAPAPDAAASEEDPMKALQDAVADEGKKP